MQSYDLSIGLVCISFPCILLIAVSLYFVSEDDHAAIHGGTKPYYASLQTPAQLEAYLTKYRYGHFNKASPAAFQLACQLVSPVPELRKRAAFLPLLQAWLATPLHGDGADEVCDMPPA